MQAHSRFGAAVLVALAAEEEEDERSNGGSTDDTAYDSTHNGADVGLLLLSLVAGRGSPRLERASTRRSR